MEKVRVKIIKSELLSTKFEDRFIVVNEVTNEILDDAQGYGYKTKQSADKGWAYKNRDKSKDNERKAYFNKFKNWLKKHKSFSKDMEYYAIQIAKGSLGPDEKFDSEFVEDMLKSRNLEIDFKVSDLIKVRSKM